MNFIVVTVFFYNNGILYCSRIEHNIHNVYYITFNYILTLYFVDRACKECLKTSRIYCNDWNGFVQPKTFNIHERTHCLCLLE